jgi:hypothetical protein
MGVLNRIMLILILLAAAGAAVLSYFLFEKRTQMLNGWKQMEDQIIKTAAELDKGSETQLAAVFQNDALHHRGSLSDMQSKLNSLSDGAQKVIRQRDALANTIRQIAADVEVTTVDVAQLQNVDKYNEYSRNIVGSVKNIRSRNDAIVRSFIAAGSALQVSGTESGIKGDKGDKFLKDIRTAVNKKNTRISTYEANLQKIGRDVEKTFDKSEGSYARTAADIATGVSVQKNTLNATQSELSSAKNTISSLERTRDNLNQTIAKKNEMIAAKDAMIKDLNHKLNPTGDADIQRLLFGKKDIAYYRDLYTIVKGNVKKVDDKWNFVVLDLGEKVKVYQTFAGKTFSSILDIPAGKTISVVRGLGTEKPKFIGKVVLSEVHSDYAIGNIDTTKLKSDIEEGDAVIFLDDDLDLLLKDFKIPEM